MLKGAFEPGCKIATERSREQEKQSETECDSAEVSSVWGREG